MAGFVPKPDVLPSRAKLDEGGSNSHKVRCRMTVEPDIRLPIVAAQEIVDSALPGRRVVAISNLHGGEISAVYELALAEDQAPIVLKAYPGRHQHAHRIEKQYLRRSRSSPSLMRQ